MADVAARREARRRRILENAEYRMQRITGGWTSDTKQNDIEKESQVNPIETNECEKIKTEIQATTSTCTANGILANETLVGHQTLDSLINEINADINNDETNSSPYDDMFGDILNTLSNTNDRDRESFYEPRRRNAGRTNVPNENGNATGSIKRNASIGLNSERQDALAGTQIDTDRDNSISNLSAESSTFNILLSSRLIYVILAILINIIVALRMEHLFGTSIVVPFFIVMIGRLCICNTHDESRGSNMLVAALILSNVRPDFVKIIHRLKNALSLFRIVLQDFAVYIFTFVIVYTIIYRYWNDLDDILPFVNEPKVIFNENAAI